MKKVSQFASIQKVESNDDGTITVIGIASDESKDADGEVITADAMRAAIPDYMALGTGALREMHQLSAAGRVDKAEVNELGQTVIEAVVVDPIAILKVQQGVYKGFSVGGSSTGRSGKTVTGLRLTEISLVDKPNNPNSVIQMWKCEDFNKAGDSPAPSSENEMTIETEVNKSEQAGDIKKGMYSLKEFANVIRDIGSLTFDAQYESQSEGDNSPIPAALLDWLKQGVEIFNGMAVEETTELVASLQKSAAAQDIQKAEQATAAVTATVETDIQKAEKPETVVAADVKPEAIEKAEIVTDTAKPEDKIQKTEESTDINKALAPLMDVIKALQSQNETLAKSQQDLLDKVNAMPVAPKGVLIEKALDTSSQSLQQEQQNTVDPVRKADGSIDDAATMLKQHYITAQPMQLNR
jgi:hypothetical protein